MTHAESTRVFAVSAAAFEVPDDIDIRPTATSDEVVAILAAYAELWPKPGPDEPGHHSTDWRFVGRWWRGSGPLARWPIRR